MGVLREMSQSPEPFMRLKLPFPGVRAAVVTTPELVQEILVEKAKSFEKSDMLRFSLRSLAGDGLFTSKYDLWKRQRKLMAPLFTPRALEAYVPDMIACSERTIADWTDGRELSLAAETTRLTMGIAGKTLFDADNYPRQTIGRPLRWLSSEGLGGGRPTGFPHQMRRPPIAWHAPDGKKCASLRAAERPLYGPTLPMGKARTELPRRFAFSDGYCRR